MEQARLDGSGIFAALRRQGLSRWTDSQVQSLLTHFRFLRHDTASRALERIVHEMGYGEYLDRNHIDPSRLTILEMLCEAVPDIASIPARLDGLRDLVQQGAGRPDSRFVLSTIHSSKGLEYDRVVLADVIDGILPNIAPGGALLTDAEAAALEEERRLLYVAMTRARHELTLIRFDRPDLRSSFAELLFPSSPRATGPKITRTGAVAPTFAPPAGYTPTPRPDARLTALAKEFYTNTRVRHKCYGAGVIVRRQDDTVTIRFHSGEERRFDLMTALRAKALELA